jgi:hypothetical protein
MMVEQPLSRYIEKLSLKKRQNKNGLLCYSVAGADGGTWGLSAPENKSNWLLIQEPRFS